MIFRKFAIGVAAITAAFAFAGCLYENPLTGHSSQNLDTWLLGVWEQMDPAEGKRTQVAVLPQSSDRYTVWWRELTPEGKELKTYQYEGWLSRVGKLSFLTLKDVDPRSDTVGKYFFVQHELLAPSEMRIRVPSLDESSRSASSFHLRQEVRRKARERTLFESEPTRWLRVSEVYQPEKGDNRPQPYQKPRDPGVPGAL